MDIQKGSMRPSWVADGDVTYCQNCRQNFTVVTRRHHCRACGNIFCNSVTFFFAFKFNFFSAAIVGFCYLKGSTIRIQLGYATLASRNMPIWTEQGSPSNSTPRKKLTLLFRTFDVMGPADAPAIIILHPSLATRKYHLYQVGVSGIFVEFSDA